PGIRNLTSAEEALRNELAAIRKELKKKGELFNLCRFSEKEWREGIVATIEPTRLLLNLVEEFGKRYRDAKSELRALDFADLEQLALAVLGTAEGEGEFKPTMAAQSYRQQFKHVLVDEYQDVNEVQDTILSLVSRDAPTRNLFSVGDVKQSIYR